MENRSYLELTFRSINCFADNGQLDANELEDLIQFAKRDGIIDDNEKRVLGNIISRVREHEIDEALAGKISELEAMM